MHLFRTPTTERVVRATLTVGVLMWLLIILAVLAKNMADQAWGRGCGWRPPGLR